MKGEAISHLDELGIDDTDIEIVTLMHKKVKQTAGQRNTISNKIWHINVYRIYG